MLKKIFSNLGVGLAIGWIVTTACLWAWGCGSNDVSGIVIMRHMTIWMIASALYGLISLIYDSDLPLTAAIPIHFLSCGLVTFIASWAAGLFEIFSPWPYWFIYVLPTFVVVYLIIGGISTFVELSRAKQINDKIN